MSRESNLAISIWDAVNASIPSSKRLDAATNIMRALEEYGFEAKDLELVVDEDPWYLGKAFRDVFEIDEEDHDDYSEDDEE